MSFVEKMRKMTILQRSLIVGSIVWILTLISLSYHRTRSFDIGKFSGGLILVVVVWGAYLIIIVIMRKGKKELDNTGKE